MVNFKTAEAEISFTPGKQQKLSLDRSMFCDSKINGLRALRIKPERVFKAGVLFNYFELFRLRNKLRIVQDGRNIIKQVE